MTLPIPTANQPIDYDFINAITNEINRISTEVAGLNQNSTSSINGKEIRQSNLVFFGTGVQVPSPSASSRYAEVSVSFSTVSFKDAPIVTATAKTDLKTAIFTISVKNITNKGCILSIVWSTEPPSGITTISLLAVGQRAI